MKAGYYDLYLHFFLCGAIQWLQWLLQLQRRKSGEIAQRAFSLHGEEVHQVQWNQMSESSFNLPVQLSYITYITSYLKNVSAFVTRVPELSQVFEPRPQCFSEPNPVLLSAKGNQTITMSAFCRFTPLPSLPNVSFCPHEPISQQ